jgi:hypothetical protein
MGLVKVAFLWELLTIGFHVRGPLQPPCARVYGPSQELVCIMHASSAPSSTIPGP